MKGTYDMILTLSNGRLEKFGYRLMRYLKHTENWVQMRNTIIGKLTELSTKLFSRLECHWLNVKE